MPRTLFRLLITAFVSGAWLWAQEPSYTLRVDARYVSLDVSVTDVSGESVDNLTQDDFQIFEEGVPQNIRSFSPVSAPYDILLLFDRSGSTQHKWAFMQRAVAGFISSLKPQDRIAICTFDFEFDVISRWTAPRTESLLALAELIRPKAVGGTEFYRSLERALRREFRTSQGRRAVVVLTDGRDTSFYRHLVMKNQLLPPDQDRPYQRTLRAARDQRIPTYFIAINTDRNLELNTQGGDEYRNLRVLFPGTDMPLQYLTEVRTRMEQISDVSGGRVLYPKGMEDIVPLYEQIGRELGMSYSLGYVPSNLKSAGAYRRIEVKLRNSQLRVSQSRTGYYAR